MMEAELELREITLWHHVLFGVFGLAPWNITSALFAQLPLVLPASPQMAQLPSYMDVATNLGNVPMLLYLACVGKSQFAARAPQSLNAATVYVLFAVALLTAAGFAFLWDVTVAGFSVFVVLFALCGGIVGDVMMVTAFPYLTQFHPCVVCRVSRRRRHRPSRISRHSLSRRAARAGSFSCSHALRSS